MRWPTLTLLSLTAGASALVACTAQRPVVTTDDPRLPLPPSLETRAVPSAPSTLVAIVQAIPENASKPQVEEALKRFLPEFYRLSSGEMQQAVSAVAALKTQPNIVSALIDQYEILPGVDYGRRLMVLQLVGELRRTEGMPALQKIIWAPLPEKQALEEGMTPRDLEEMVRVKAVHGLAYLRTPEAAKATIEIMQRHESMAVRVAAIDAHMWNHRDSAATARELYGLLPTELHKFVERPRFHRGIDRDQFNEQLKVWRKRWAAPPKEQ
jgi:hypothetical protein